MFGRLSDLLPSAPQGGGLLRGIDEVLLSNECEPYKWSLYDHNTEGGMPCSMKSMGGLGALDITEYPVKFQMLSR